MEHVYETTSQPVFNYVARRCGGGEDVRDIVAEVYLTVWRRLDDVPANGTLPWILAVARRTLANHRRATHRQHRLHERLRSAHTAHLDSADASFDDRSDVTRALEQLGELDREVLTLLAWEELSISETAVVLGITPGAARTRLHRARQRLAQQLDDHTPRPDAATTLAPTTREQR